jgi:hypothetical protein
MLMTSSLVLSARCLPPLLLLLLLQDHSMSLQDAATLMMSLQDALAVALDEVVIATWMLRSMPLTTNSLALSVAPRQMKNLVIGAIDVVVLATHAEKADLATRVERAALVVLVEKVASVVKVAEKEVSVVKVAEKEVSAVKVAEKEVSAVKVAEKEVSAVKVAEKAAFLMLAAVAMKMMESGKMTHASPASSAVVVVEDEAAEAEIEMIVMVTVNVDLLAKSIQVDLKVLCHLHQRSPLLLLSIQSARKRRLKQLRLLSKQRKRKLNVLVKRRKLPRLLARRPKKTPSVPRKKRSVLRKKPRMLFLPLTPMHSTPLLKLSRVA